MTQVYSPIKRPLSHYARFIGDNSTDKIAGYLLHSRYSAIDNANLHSASLVRFDVLFPTKLVCLKEFFEIKKKVTLNFIILSISIFLFNEIS